MVRHAIDAWAKDEEAEREPMTDESMMETLRTIQADLAALRTTQAADLADLKSKFAALPDLHFLQAAAMRQMRETTEWRDYRRRTETQLDEIYKAMATDTEIKRLRD